MSLTDVRVRNAKPKEKAYKIADEKGLYLYVTPQGGKYWRFKYRYMGREKKLAFGVYPDVSLAKAREKRDDARKELANDIDPAVMKQVNKRAKKLAAKNSFEAVTREWFAKYQGKWTKNHAERIIRRLEVDVFPWLGRFPIVEIKAPDLLNVLRRIEARGAIETAHRAHQNCSQVFRYAIATGHAERDPAADLRGALQPVKKRHHASIVEPRAVGALLRALNDYQGDLITMCALQFVPLVFVRPGELRQAEWSEINLEKAEWRIPGEKMKMRITHIVPLSVQALAILREIHPLTGDGKYVFPNRLSDKRPMSENTILAALRRLGYSKEEMTGHGFRSLASTLLNENGWNRDAIERQLAHSEKNNIRAAYNYAEYLPERRRMMQWWADYLDSLASGAKVVELKVG